MNVTCDIIRDLLPLYAENMVSEDSRQLVNGHLCDCDSCTRELAKIKKSEPIPVEVNAEPLNNVKKMIIRRRMLSVMASVFSLLTLVSFIISFLFAPFQLTAEQALDDFYVREDGAVVIDYSSAVIGRSRSGNNENWFLIQYSTRYDMWKGENRKTLEETFGADGNITEEERLRYENIDICTGHWETPGGAYHFDAAYARSLDSYVHVPESEMNWWYSDPTGLGNDTLLHDAGREMPEKADRYQFDPVYPMIFFGSIAAALVLLILRKIIKLSWGKEFATRLVILSGSAAFSTLFVSSGRIFTSSVGIIDNYWGWMIGMNTVFLSLTILFWRQLHLLNKQDKGE